MNYVELLKNVTEELEKANLGHDENFCKEVIEYAINNSDDNTATDHIKQMITAYQNDVLLKEGIDTLSEKFGSEKAEKNFNIKNLYDIDNSSLLQYINQIAGGNLKDTRGFGMARVSSSSKNLPMFKKILIDSKDKKSMYQEKQDYLESKEGQNNLVKGQFVYPQGLLNIGSKYGQELAGSIKIKGISLYANFKALDKILNDNINNNKN